LSAVKLISFFYIYKISQVCWNRFFFFFRDYTNLEPWKSSH